MSQKTNPVSLRLKKTNKNFSSCWYSDYFFDQMSNHDLQIRPYVESVSDQIGHSQSSCYIKHSYKKYCLYLFLLDSRAIRNERQKHFRLPRKAPQSAVAPNRIMPNTSHIDFLHPLLFYNKEANSAQSSGKLQKLMRVCADMSARYEKQSGASFFPSKQSLQVELDATKLSSTQPTATAMKTATLSAYKLPQLKVLSLTGASLLKRMFVLCSERIGQADATASAKVFVKQNLINRYNKLIPTKQNSNQTLTKSNLVASINAALALPKEYQHSLSVSKANATHNNRGAVKAPFHAALETTLYSRLLTPSKLCPIRVVQDSQSAQFLAQETAYLLQRGVSFKQIQNQIVADCTKNESVKGIRLSCSGRVGGRSKKAQKSKLQSMQWGNTSLHVFSSRLSFWKTSANTSFGKIGIKLWLCYK